MKPQHIALAVLITAIWGFNFSLIKLSLASVDPLLLAGIRFSLCAFPALLFIRRPQVPWRYLISYGLVFGIGLWGVVNLGIKAGLSAGIASLVLQVSAFISLLLGAWLFKEQLNRYQLLGMLLALGGLLCIILITDGSVSLSGVLLVLFGAVAWSMANIIIKRANTQQPLAFLVWASAFAPLPLFALDYAVNGSNSYHSLISQLDASTVLAILYQVYPNTLFAYWLWNSLLKTYPVSTVAPLSLLVPIFGLLGSVLVFAESVPLSKALAVILIILGLAVGLYGQRIVKAFAARIDRRPEPSQHTRVP